MCHRCSLCKAVTSCLPPAAFRFTLVACTGSLKGAPLHTAQAAFVDILLTKSSLSLDVLSKPVLILFILVQKVPYVAC